MRCSSSCPLRPYYHRALGQSAREMAAPTTAPERIISSGCMSRSSFGRRQANDTTGKWHPNNEQHDTAAVRLRGDSQRDCERGSRAGAVFIQSAAQCLCQHWRAVLICARRLSRGGGVYSDGSSRRKPLAAAVTAAAAQVLRMLADRYPSAGAGRSLLFRRGAIYNINAPRVRLRERVYLSLGGYGGGRSRGERA